LILNQQVADGGQPAGYSLTEYANAAWEKREIMLIARSKSFQSTWLLMTAMA